MNRALPRTAGGPVSRADRTETMERNCRMKALNQASCIWIRPSEKGKDLYGIFRKEFQWTAEKNSRVFLEIAADSTFAAYVNGHRCPVSQTADFPTHRTASILEITGLLMPGKNVIAVEVHYIGEDFLTCQRGMPFLKAAIRDGEHLLEKTDASWKCAESAEYRPGLACKVTSQLGFVFEYDARNASPWKELSFDDSSWRPAAVCRNAPEGTMTERKVPQFLELPLPRAEIVQAGYLRRDGEAETFAKTCSLDWLSPRRPEEVFESLAPECFSDGMLREKPHLNPDGTSCFQFRKPDPPPDGYYIVLDLQKERVGFPVLKLSAPAGTVVDICHGEHLDDGRVRAWAGGRNFCDRCHCREGLNEFVHTHRRIGGRYLELHITNTGGGTVALHYAGMIPLELPLPPEARFLSDDRFLTRLNRLSADTLKLCMHEHYEDCPWREQALYAYDSRNQILYGYYVWGNYDFAAACIDLLGHSFDGERYLALTAPGACNLTIPIFTLVWISEIYEHLLYSGSPALFERWRSQIDRILDRALAEPDPASEGLYHPGNGGRIWNFCEWNGALSGLKDFPQAPYNIYLYEALLAGAKLHELAGNRERAAFLRAKADALGTAAERVFWNPAHSCYGALPPGKDELNYEHVQAVFLANGLVPEEKKTRLLSLFRSGKLRGIDLSGLCYLVRGLMKCGAEGRAFLTEALRGIFEPIVYSGATSLWETRHGSGDFNGAGSLCHAWSSVMPYFCGHCLLGVTPLEPGFRRFSVKPYCGGLPRASGEVPTPSGPVRVSWECTKKGLNVTVEHPSGTLPVFESLEECPIARAEAVPR